MSSNSTRDVTPFHFIEHMENWKCYGSKLKATSITSVFKGRSLIGRSLGEHCANVCTHQLHCCKNKCTDSKCPGHVACEVGLGLGIPIVTVAGIAVATSAAASAALAEVIGAATSATASTGEAAALAAVGGGASAGSWLGGIC